MLIKFKDSDPRAGTTVRMDSHRGRELIEAGAAVEVQENEAAAEPTREQGPEPAAVQVPAKTSKKK